MQMVNVNNLTELEKDFLLQLFFHHAQPEMRRVLMRTIPAIYNKAVGQKVCEIENIHTEEVLE